MIHATDNTLPAVEVPSAAESRHAHIEFKLQMMGNHVRNFVVESARWVRYWAMFLVVPCSKIALSLVDCNIS
jgi:hypothetical protein